jgi:exopolysaccharide production protein ExoQ
MPPELAALICLLFVSYLFWVEWHSPGVDSISWVPFAWMFIAGSRFVSRWLNLTGPGESPTAYSDGSPVDRTVFLFLIVCACVTLYRRDIDWSLLFKRNKWLIAYLVYCLASVLWADSSYVLVKRWVKELGNPLMAVVILTERRPYDALATTVRRLSFLFIPLSVLFIKYYPEIGRGYTQSGGAMYTGVGDQKNALGLIGLMTTTLYIWSLLYGRATSPAREGYQIPMMAAVAWLMYMANSQTSLMCLIVAAAMLFISRRPVIAKQPTRLITLTFVAVMCYVMGDAVFGLRDDIVELLGRDATLTNRTAIWDVVTRLQTNPLVGAGFMSFWAGDRQFIIWDALRSPGLNQAHNGYLEQYLNLGYVGVGFIGAIVLAGILNVRKHCEQDYQAAALRFTLITIALLYNYTEASFYGINNMWVLLLFAAINIDGVADREDSAVVQSHINGVHGRAVRETVRSRWQVAASSHGSATPSRRHPAIPRAGSAIAGLTTRNLSADRYRKASK